MIAYLITNRSNGRQYIGVTSKTLARRWANHIAEAVSSGRRALCRAIRKYGKEKFSVVVIASATSASDLLELEKILIMQYGTKAPNGYNMTGGGDGTIGLTHSIEARKKIGLASKGRICSQSRKEKIGAAHKGKRLTEDHRTKLSLAKIGKKMPVRSEEHKRRISEGLVAAHKRRKESKIAQNNSILQ